MNEERRLRYIIAEGEAGGFLVYPEEWVVVPGVAPEPFFTWMPIEGQAKHTATWTEAVSWTDTLRHRDL